MLVCVYVLHDMNTSGTLGAAPASQIRVSCAGRCGKWQDGGRILGTAGGRGVGVAGRADGAHRDPGVPALRAPECKPVGKHKRGTR